MTAADFRDFRAAIERTAAAFGKALPETLTGTYFDDLGAYPLTAVLAALDKARREMRFFPRVSSLRELCETDSAVVVPTAVPEWIDHDHGRYWCEGCQDTGYARGLECPGDGTCHLGSCGRDGHNKDPHPYTRACSCRPTNPILIRQREMSRQRRASQREE